MKSAKNKLQEYYQAHLRELPKYITTFENGEPHKPVWKCVLSACDGIATEALGSSKKEAELRAAELALYQLDLESSEIANPRKKFHLDQDMYIFVDIENRQKFIDRLLTECEFSADDYQQAEYEQVHIYVFGAYHHPIFKRLHKQYESCEGVFENPSKFVKMHFMGVDSIYKDAADVMMCFTAGRILYESGCRDAYFVSSDKFIGSLDDASSEFGITGNICPDYDSFIRLICRPY